jgi:Na+-transporting methylmalonyl-CoA/oxaloacetate decarboxylase gamma subunit
MLGIPSIILGASATAGAVWLGLDLTGIALLAAGVIFVLLGLFLSVIGLYCAGVLLQRVVDERFRRRPKMVAAAREPAPPAPPSRPPGDGPRVF